MSSELTVNVALTALDLAPARAPARAHAYRADIDGLRAVAVSLVVLAHAFPAWLPGGFVGVDIFFVISGYLISSILMRDLAAGQFSAREFYARRVLRIFPALIVVLGVTALAGWALMYRPEFSALGGHLAASALFVENFRLAGEIGYFDARAALKPTLHLWSLAVEEQFYLIWPLTLALAFRLRLPLAPLFGALALASFAAGMAAHRADAASAYYAPQARMWELIAGALVAEFCARGGAQGRAGDLLSALGAALIAFALLPKPPGLTFPGAFALWPTLGAACLIAAGEGGAINRSLLARAPMVGLGLVSYPLYLWHWPLLSFARILWGDLSAAVALGCIALALAAAVATYLGVEAPLRRCKARRAKLVALATALAAVAGLGLAAAQGALAPRLAAYPAPDRNEWTFLKARTPDFPRNGDGVYALAPERARQVLLIGDSHVAQYAERLAADIAADPRRPGATLAVSGGCVPILEVTTPDPQRAGCPALRARGWALARSGRYETVVIGAAWNWYLRYGDFWIDGARGRVRLSSDAGVEAALARLGADVSALKRSGARVVLLLDEPEAPAFDFARWPLRAAAASQGFAPRVVRLDPSQAALHARLQRFAEQLGVETVDPLAAICGDDFCQATTATGEPVYKDDNHFNPDWIAARATFIDAVLEPPAGESGPSRGGGALGTLSLRTSDP